MSTYEDTAAVLLDVTFVLQLQPSIKLEDVSESVIDFTGYSQQDYLTRPRLWLGAVDPRDRQVMLSAFNAAESRLTSLQLRFRTQTGESIWVHQMGRVVRQSNDTVMFHGGLTRIPQPRTVTSAEERYQLLAEDDVILEADLNGRVMWVSDSISRAGWTPAELIGTPATRLVLPADRSVMASVQRRVTRAETVSGIVLRMRTKHGRVRFISTTASPLFNAKGEVAGTIVGWHDVDEVAQAHHAAESERQLLRATLDAQLDPQVLVEAVRDSAGVMTDLRFIEANRASADFMGIAREEVVGGTLQALQPHMFGQAQIGYLAERIASREPLVLNDFLHEMHGRLRRFDVRAVPVDDGMAVTWRDVTDRFDASQALTRSEAHYRVLLQEISDIVSFHDLTGGVQWISPALERVLGWPAEIANTTVMKMHPDDVEVVKAIREELRAGAQSVTRRIRLQHRDGSYRWMQTTTRAVRDEKDEPVSLVVISRDIQEQVAAEAALAASEARYRLLAEHATDVVYQVSDKGVTEWISDGVEPILGFTAQEFIGRPGLEFVVAEDRDYVTVMTRQVLSGQRGSVRFRMYTKNGGTRWVEATIHPVSDEAGVRIGVVGGWRDVQAEVEAREALDIRARTDDLTGLLNRREALSQLVHSLAQGDGLREQLAVAFCDVDGFKGINDSMGHSVGDRLLQSVADRIRACVRAGDTVARVGGDEILLILRGVRTVDDAMAIAEKVRLAVREPLYVQDQTVPISVSVGVTMAAADDDVDALVARADRAMYLAKEAGRDQVVRI